MLKTAFVTLILAVVVAAGGQTDRPVARDWPFYGGDQAGTKFSPLTDVNPSNVGRLAVAWEWAVRETALAEFGTRPGVFQTTPLMIDNALYFSTPYNRVVSLDADTGAGRWSFDPKAY